MARRKVQEVVRLSLGVDVGNGYCKFNGMKFASKFTQGALLNVGVAAKEVHRVTFGGKEYLVGTGDTFLGENRYFSLGYLLSILTALYLSAEVETKHIIADICLGVPVELYMANNMEIVKKIKDYYTNTSHNIIIDGRLVEIDIENVTVFIEGAYPVLEGIEKRVITLDIGAGTLDATEFKTLTPTAWKTYHYGMNYFYDECSAYLKLAGVNYEPTEIDELLDKDEIIYKGKSVNLVKLREFLQEKINGVISEVQKKFEFAKAEEICLIGGGSSKLSKYLEKAITEITDNAAVTIVDNAQYINSAVYETILEDIAADSEEE